MFKEKAACLLPSASSKGETEKETLTRPGLRSRLPLQPSQNLIVLRPVDSAVCCQPLPGRWRYKTLQNTPQRFSSLIIFIDRGLMWLMWQVFCKFCGSKPVFLNLDSVGDFHQFHKRCRSCKTPARTKTSLETSFQLPSLRRDHCQRTMRASASRGWCRRTAFWPRRM